MKHLIHIGFPKAASTFLQEWFAQHPELFYRHGALGGFDDVYQTSREAAKNEELNRKYFVTSSEGLTMPRASSGNHPIEYSTGNYLPPVPLGISQEKACRILKELYPNARILVITRGFKSSVLSGYSQYVKGGGTLTFGNLARTSAGKSAEYYIIDYNYIQNLYENVFGAENVLAAPYELLRDDNRKFIRVIEDFLDLSHYEHDIGKVNESLSAEELYWYPRISWRVARLARKFGANNYAKFYNWYIGQIMGGKFKRTARLLSRWRQAEKISERDVPQSFIEVSRGKATVFRDNPLYAAYLSEYLLDGER